MKAYIRDVANQLGLREWAFHLSDFPPEKGGLGGSFGATIGRRHGELRFADSARADWSAEEWRQTVIHELLHAHLAPLRATLFGDLFDNRLLSQLAYELFFDGCDRHMEYAVDGIAVAIAPMFPLIEWPKGEDTCSES